VSGESLLDEIPCPDSEYHIAIELRFGSQQITDHVDAHHLLVDGVGLDVLGVEVDAGFGGVHPPQRFDEPA
jgi:hypothetical protein